MTSQDPQEESCSHAGASVSCEPAGGGEQGAGPGQAIPEGSWPSPQLLGSWEGQARGIIIEEG